ncbi:DUF4118 domain-containing protein [Streptomyces lydicus]|uniref:DUF4118 domain-containing protein n=1 Tax=Streptomyces lydicus TaxID=47763 RepID=UPI00379F4250
MAVFHPPSPVHRPHVPRAPRPGTPPLRALPRPRTARRTAAHGRTLARDLAVPFGAVAAALLATVLLLTGGTGRTTVVLAAALAVFALLTLLVSALAGPLMMPVVALVSWMFYDGFVLHQRSDLAFQQPDRTGLLVLLLAGAAGAGCAAAVRSLRRRRTS